MSDIIKHECGIALIRLLKPLEYYQIKYGSWEYGLQKLYLLMEKQHNRGQDGGYAMAGLIGHGDAFVVRDRWGIRPAFYYYDEEIAIVASERPVI
ncbi:hypothetical protein ES708_18584 [subsurface metagenome]